MDTYHKFLHVEGLGKTFLSEKEPKTVLNEVSFDLPLPDSLAIVGTFRVRQDNAHSRHSRAP